MNHATDSLLLAYHDGEIDGSALAELRDHLASCTQCTQELDELRRLSGVLHEALALTDVPAPATRVQPAAAAAAVSAPAMTLPLSARRTSPWGRLWTSSLAKAALFLLAFTGVLTAIPGSPARKWLEGLIDRERAVDTTAPVDAPVPTPNELSVEPAGGQVRVVVNGARDVDVTVELVDAPKASVEALAAGQEVRLTSASGRAEVSGLKVGTLRIGIPRDVGQATVEANGQVLVRFADGQLQLEGPAGTTRGDQVSFRIAQ